MLGQMKTAAYRQAVQNLARGAARAVLT